MEFNSFTYLFFLAAILVMNWLAPGRWRRWILLLASYIFYGAWSWKFCGLIAASTIVDYVAGANIHAGDAKARRWWLTGSIITNLGILGFFKYSSFFVESFCRLFGLDDGGLLPRIILPVGISFYTFQSMSYTIDIFRRRLAPRKSFVDFALYVSFFPQLVAGPIIRAIDFLPQLDRWKRPVERQLQSGITLIMLGLIEKTVFADNFGIHSDRYFNAPGALPGFLPAITGTFAFAMQIYFDFAGYSHIAIGTAHLLGFRFMENFRRPYLSTNVSEFWRRWHISLSTWLRDYLYIPLGGNRHGRLLTLRNLMITMTLGGLWHGASWHFVVWGVLHGFLLAVHRFYVEFVRPRLPGPLLRSVVYAPMCWVATMLAIGVTWIPFRASGMADAFVVLRNAVMPAVLGKSVLPNPLLLAGIGALFAFFLEEKFGIIGRIDRAPEIVRGALIALATIVIAIFAVTEIRIQFIYFRF